MTDPSEPNGAEAILPAEPRKSPERLRQEELFLTIWRVVLLIAAIWALVYAWIGMFWPLDRLEYLATETPHGGLQFGVCMFLGAELLYYLYISSTFRRCREWGMAVWALGLIAVILNLNFRI